MADQEHEDGQEPLSKREQKALQVLAGEIVREAGLVRDQEQEAAEKRLQRVIDGVLEHWKAQIDFFKHMSTASGAALLLLIAVIGAYQPGFAPTLVFLLAAAGFVGSALAAVFYLWVATTRLQLFLLTDDDAFRDAARAAYLTDAFDQPRRRTLLLFSVGLAGLGGVVLGGLFEGF